MRFFKYFFFLFVTIIITECKAPVYFKTTETSIKIDSNYTNNSSVNQLIKPYKKNLDAEMNEVLIVSSEEFPKEKGKPETKLGNLVADLSLKVANKLYQPTDGHKIDFCLLNFGGLRTSLPKGNITRGKIFELMPFENELVVVTINQAHFDSLISYIKHVGGQPIAGFKIKFSSNKPNIIFKYRKNNKSLNGTYKVLTSDYLATGGDNMNFFLSPIKIEPVGIKLRDAIIKYCIEQNKKGKQLEGKLDGRIVFEKQ